MKIIVARGPLKIRDSMFFGELDLWIGILWGLGGGDGGRCVCMCMIDEVYEVGM